MTPLPTPTLAGTHVTLVPMSLDHVDGLVAAANENRATFDWTTVPSTADEMAIHIGRLNKLRDAATWMPFTTTRMTTRTTTRTTARAGNGEVIGATAFLSIEWWGRGEFPDSVEIGSTWLTSSAQRTVANTEAKLLMLTHAFEVWGVQRMQLKTDARNERSRNAIARLGAQFEGVLRNFQPGAGAKGAGAPRDTAMFSILPSEWPTIRDRLAGLVHTTPAGAD
jgi:N-acetyltransferase